MEKTFYFNEISNIETQNFDNTLEHFYRSGIEGLIRENIQNSLDACQNRNNPVKVKIDLFTMSKERLPDIKNIELHVNSLIGGNDYTQETIKHMKSTINNDNIDVLTFEDSNTRGLSGADQIDKDTTYNIFAYKKGVHFRESDDSWENTRGGSHGVGKIANNAASDIHLMYFANYDEFGKQQFGGTIQLIEHQVKDKFYRSTGYFTDINKGHQYVPYENKGLDKVFHKNSQGLKLIVPFLKEDYAEVPSIVRAVIDNFFISLINEKLEVEIVNSNRKIHINKNTLHEIIRNKNYYPKNLDDITAIKKTLHHYILILTYQINRIPYL